jgi:hypothetical protein
MELLRIIHINMYFVDFCNEFIYFLTLLMQN